jgi:hypothetical protein
VEGVGDFNFNGTLRNSGVDVCLVNGTNCPSGLNITDRLISANSELVLSDDEYGIQHLNGNYNNTNTSYLYFDDSIQSTSFKHSVGITCDYPSSFSMAWSGLCGMYSLNGIDLENTNNSIILWSPDSFGDHYLRLYDSGVSDGKAHMITDLDTISIEPGNNMTEIRGNLSIGHSAENITLEYANNLALVTTNDKLVSIDPRNEYKSLYDFRTDTIGGNPSGWTITENGNGAVQVLSSLGGHNSVVEMYSGTSFSSSGISQSFSGQTSGEVQYYYRITNSNIRSNLYLESASIDNAITFYVDNGNFLAEDDLSTRTLTACSNNQWYHIRVGFNIVNATHGWYVFIDGTRYPTAGYYGWYNPASPATISHIWFLEGLFETPTTVYVDAVDYSWAPGYYPNRNLFEEKFLIDDHKVGNSTYWIDNLYTDTANIGMLNATNSIQANDYYSGDNSQGITNTTGYWACKNSYCNITCQLQIKDGLITGCT